MSVGIPLVDGLMEATNPASFASKKDVYVYERGTGVEAQLYGDEALTEPVSQPLVTDAAGRPHDGSGRIVWAADSKPKDIELDGQRQPWNPPGGGAVDLSGYQQIAQKGAANGYASLEAAGKVPVSQLPSAVMEYQGAWNASTNSPALKDGTGSAGDVYRVSVAGERNLGSGSISFEVGDYAVYNGTTWEKSDTTDAVASVAGKKGVVTLGTGDVEGLTAALAGKQALDSDLTEIAALATKPFGRELLTKETAALARAFLEAQGAIGGFYNAKDYGAKGNGATDDATAIQNAIYACATAGGGVVYLPAGTFIVGTTLILEAGVALRGAGAYATTLKLKNGANTDLLRTTNYGTGGAYKFAITSLSADGNQANNTSGNGLAIDGLTFVLRDLLIHDFAQAGITGKKTSVEEGSAFGYMDAWIENVKSYLNAKGGVAWEGPHDAHFSNCQAISNHTFGFKFFGEGFAAKTYACHAYGDHEYGFQIEASIKAVNCESEGASKAQVALWSDNNHWVGGTAFRDASSATDGKVGFQFGRTVAEGGEKSAFNTQIIGVRVNDCTNGAFKLANGWGGSRIQAYVYATSGKAFAGTAPTQGQLDCQIHLQGGVELGVTTAADRRYADSATAEVIALWVKGDTHPHLVVSPGRLGFSDGTVEPDAFLERSGVNALSTPGRLTAAELKTAVVQVVKGNKGPAGGALNNLLAALNEVGVIKNESASATLEVASASTISLGENCPTLVKLTGTAEVKKINATNTGHVVYVLFTSTAKLVAGENLKLPATISGTSDDVVCLICDGTNWYQVATPSVNP